MGRHRKRHRAGDRQQQRELRRAVIGVAPALFVPRLQAARNVGQQHHPDGDRNHPQRQLVQAVGIGEPADRPLVERRDLPPDQQVDLHHAPRQHGGRGDRQKAAQVGRHPRQAQPQRKAHPAGREPDRAQLHQTRDRRGPRHRQPHVPAEAFGHQHRGDQHNVHQDRRGGGRDEPPARVQQPRQQRRQRHEQNIRKADPPVDHGQGKAFVARKARRHRQDQPRHRDGGDHRHQQHDPEQPGEGVLGEPFRVVAGFQLLGEDRHEGGVERPFGEEAAEHVGQREGDQIRLGHRAGAQERGDQDVAGEPHHAAGQRPASDGQEARDQADRFHRAGVLRSDGRITPAGR